MSVALKKLQDYKPSDFSITEVSLVFDIQIDKVIVSTDIFLTKNNQKAKHLYLDGEDLKIIEIKIDNRILNYNEYTYEDDTLKLAINKFTMNRFISFFYHLT